MKETKKECWCVGGCMLSKPFLQKQTIFKLPKGVYCEIEHKCKDKGVSEV